MGSHFQDFIIGLGKAVPNLVSFIPNLYTENEYPSSDWFWNNFMMLVVRNRFEMVWLVFRNESKLDFLHSKTGFSHQSILAETGYGMTSQYQDFIMDSSYVDPN